MNSLRNNPKDVVKALDETAKLAKKLLEKKKKKELIHDYVNEGLKKPDRWWIGFNPRWRFLNQKDGIVLDFSPLLLYNGTINIEKQLIILWKEI